MILIDAVDIPRQKLIPSIRAIIRHILDPKDGTVFLKMEYDEKGEVMEAKNIINTCVV